VEGRTMIVPSAIAPVDFRDSPLNFYLEEQPLGFKI
jgi:hypothetical protein